jgi:DNA mismatch repair protein MutS
MVVRTPNTGTKANGTNLTPAMRQYQEQKERVPDAILFFRMGDFYETFYEDAKTASRILGITLTSRSKGDAPIPLAGIPYHALDTYLTKLVAAGFKVAISEQVEDPKTAKGVVKREIVRIVTAGTLTDETLLDERRENVLASATTGPNGIGVAAVELASGRFRVFEESSEGVLDELVRLRPAELLIDDHADASLAALADELRTLCGTSISKRDAFEFSQHQAQESLHDHFDVATLEGFGIDGMDASVRSAGAIVRYLAETQKTSIGHIKRIERHRRCDALLIDHNTWRSLEIERTLRTSERDGSLLSAIDRTVHPMGARRLTRWLCNPLVDPDAIVARQDTVSSMVEAERTRSEIRDHLRRCADIERIAARVALKRAMPRDLLGLSLTLATFPEIRDALGTLDPPLIGQWRSELEGLDDLSELLARAIHPDAPATLRDGGVIAEGFCDELDELRTIRRNGQGWLADYQRRQIEETGIPTLKIAYNRVFGFYIEISHAHSDKVPHHYVRKQTIKAAERYITDELKTYESKVLTAEEKAVDLEVRLFEELRETVAERVDTLLRAAASLSQIDVVSALAELAVERRYTRPTIIPNAELRIVDGRHPVLEQTVRDGFVPNDTELDDRTRAWIITGPNMSGKSTYMRQTALLVLLAQVGSYVPASEMRFGVADRLFARVGASDEITRNKSTFMVEMTEAANILNNATERSLVILDEIGRGTSTFDGLSLAWAITEHLAGTTRCRTLVATHYHEMTELADQLDTVRNYNVAVREWPEAVAESDRIVFLHKIVPGGCDKSYGLHVAAMAGVPAVVLDRSAELLDRLRSGDTTHKPVAASNPRAPAQMPLFDDPGDDVLEELAGIDIDQTTPMAAFEQLRRLQQMLSGRPPD